MTERLYTTEEAARVLAVPPALIRKWRHREQAMPAGVLPGSAPGGRILLWRLEELHALADQYHQRRATR